MRINSFPRWIELSSIAMFRMSWVGIAFYCSTGFSQGMNLTKPIHSIIPDFRVNGLDAVSGAQQTEPAVAMNGKITVIVWEDTRNGDSDIYAKRLDIQGNPIGEDFLINSDHSGRDQTDPDIAISDEGHFIITWSDQRLNARHIFFQRFAPTGEPVGRNGQVSDFAGNHYRPAIAVDVNSGEFVISWDTHRDIYLRQYDSLGMAKGPCLKANTTDMDRHHYKSDVAMDSSNHIIVAWTGIKQCWAQRFDALGNPLGENICVTDSLSHIHFCRPTTVAAAPDGRFIVAWADLRFDCDVFAQCFDTDGQAVGLNFKVNDDDSGSTQYRSAMTLLPADQIMTVWKDARSGEWDIYGQMIHLDGSTIEENFRIADVSDYGYYDNPGISSNKEGKVAVVWVDQRNSNLDIYAQLLDSGLPSSGGNFLVNDDVTAGHANMPSMGVDGQGNFTVVWGESFRMVGDIMMGRFSSYGSHLGETIKVNDNVNPGRMSNPSVCVDQQGRAVAIWSDSRDGNHLFAQNYDSDGRPHGSNYQIDDLHPDEWLASSVASAVLPSGRLCLAWTVHRDTDSHLRYRISSTEGKPESPSLEIQTVDYESESMLPAIASNQKDQFILAWSAHDTTVYRSSILAQIIDQEGNLLGETMELMTPDDYANISAFDIGLDMDGRISFCWLYEENGIPSILFQQFDENGQPLTNSIKIDPSGVFQRDGLTLTTDSEGRCLIAWQDSRYGDWNVYGQRMDREDKRIGDNFRLSASEVKSQNWPAIQITGSRIYSAWVDNHIPGTGYTIWANVLDFADPDPRIYTFAQDFILHQNRPNPFNASTEILYELDEPGHVTLTIYNQRGRRVKIFVDEKQEPGVYSVLFNGNDLASGIYYYILHAGRRTFKKKMVFFR